MVEQADARHAFRRVRHETRRRHVTVLDKQQLTPGMLRIRFTSPELADFESAGADDHVKLFVPVPGTADVVARDYTPRAFDRAALTLTIDFALHDAGPATRWATDAAPGDPLQIGGPRGSVIVPDDYDWYLLVADETGLPAIGRRLGELRAGVMAIVLAVADSDAARLTFATAADLTENWLVRDSRTDGQLLTDALAQITLPHGDGFVWIAGEASAARAVRTFVTDTIGHPKAWIRASGYWLAGEAGTHTGLSN